MNKVAIVTGASRGIGSATAKLLAKNGYAVCINYLNNEKKANEVLAEITNAGGKAIVVKADVSKEVEVIRLFEKVDQELGYVNALVNNAGVGGIKKVESMDTECLELVFGTNVFGVIYCCKEALIRMKKLGGGNIVNVSSEAARFGGNNMAHYAASKAAINTFTIAFAREAGLFNIKINSVSPGIIDTDMYSEASSERIQALMKSIPLGRMGTAIEVAESILWLLSDKASYLSGTIIPVTGGR